MSNKEAVIAGLLGSSKLSRLQASSAAMRTREHNLALASLRASPIHRVCSPPLPPKRLHDTTYSAPEPPVVDQKRTGTCWLQAGVAYLSSLALARGVRVQFSVAYLSFHDKLCKARAFLHKMRERNLDERTRYHWIHEGPLTDGGTWKMFEHLVTTYGLVSFHDMDVTYHASHSRTVNKHLNRYLRSTVEEVRAAESGAVVDRVMGCVHDALLRCYSHPPVLATLARNKHNMDLSCSPLQTVSRILPQHRWSYTILTHAPDRDGGTYVGPYSNDCEDFKQDRFTVVDMDCIVSACVAQLRASVPVWFSADVAYDFSQKRSVASVGLFDSQLCLNLGVSDARDKAKRMRNHNTAPVHAMLITGVKLDAGKPVSWRVQNSWGKRSVGDGFVAASHDWFEAYVFQVAIADSFLPPCVKVTSHAISLPPWDIFATVA